MDRIGARKKSKRRREGKRRAPFPMTRTRPQGPRKQRARKKARGGDKLLDGAQQWNATCREILLPRYIELRYVTFISRAPAFIPRPPFAFAYPPSARGELSRPVAMETPRPAPRDAEEISSPLLLLPPSFVSPPFRDGCRARSKSAITDIRPILLASFPSSSSSSFLFLPFFYFLRI